ncbi:hypothetical protein EFK50_04510 [Nocardioides marmoriginsengisoli]|uniref:Uncharacterized protein n=1 Tax=Nocardioides marmoriginsengisoli TaxID=661483 RepID=A0A3N0CPG4_9ACTN|nr:hypothetical protein [Nocardioides marmoriginsengisoli]RNL65229.1 hypothetical protein EFK50_04510 [Nocardioides marmoriginsengisoli]
MTRHSRRFRPVRTTAALGLALAAALLLGGCGGDNAPSNDKASSEKPSTPSSSAPATGAADAGKPSSAEFQVIKVTKYGLSFEVPKGWTSLGADGVLTADNPTVKELAEKLGRSPADVAELMSSSIETMSITNAPPTSGFRENVNSTGVAFPDVSDEQIASQLRAIGAKVDSVEHVDSPIGDITRASYALATQGTTFRGVALGIDTGDDFVTVTISSYDEKSAAARADQVQKSLKKLS